MTEYFYCLAKYHLKGQDEIDPEVQKWLALNAPSARLVHEILSVPHPLAEQFSLPFQQTANLPLFRFKSRKEAGDFAEVYGATVYRLEEPYVVQSRWNQDA